MVIDKNSVLIGLPAYNEGKVIDKLIDNIREEGFDNILVVDDCSNDNTYNVAISKGIDVLRHPINRGAGASTATIIEYAKRNKYEYLVLMDSDGQHNPKDIKRLIDKKGKYDVVIGSRMINTKGMPIVRKIANFVGSIVTYFVFGIYVNDSQSGFKLLNRRAINKIKIHFDTFEFSSEMLGEIKKNNLKTKEIPIEVIYTQHSQSKGQSVKNGIIMIFRFILRGK